MRKHSVPVTVITGFLGSGKTTLVNRLLKERPSVRFGLVVNEFGTAALESQLLEVKKQPLFELPAGCLCCVSDGDLRSALAALVKKDPRVEHILVEASGLSSPGPLLGVLAQDGPFRLSGVLCIVDAAAFSDHEQQFPALRRQLNFANTVFLTKTDLVGPEVLGQVQARLAALKPGVAVFDAASRLPWTALLDTAPQPPQGVETADETTTESSERRRFFQGGRHHDTEVLEYTADTAMDPDRFGQVFSSLDPRILRAKGVVHLADSSARRYKYLVQYTGGQKQLYSRPWDPREPRRTTLVFLGSAFDAPALRVQLDACLTTAAL